jgi:uncharacterized protein (TIGR03435 family)
MSPSPGGLVAENVTVKMLIRAAYRVDESSMSGGSGWLDSVQYDVAAKTEQRASEEQLRLMLQKTLADRFQLRVHRETKLGSAYELVSANKNGPGLRPANAADCAAAKPPANPCGRFRKSWWRHRIHRGRCCGREQPPPWSGWWQGCSRYPDRRSPRP